MEVREQVKQTKQNINAARVLNSQIFPVRRASKKAKGIIIVIIQPMLLVLPQPE